MNFLTRWLNKFRTGRILVNWMTGERAGGGSLRKNEIVSSIANVIATNVGKLSPQVIRKNSAGTTIRNDSISRLLELRPCRECSTYDFLYRMASDLILYSDAFALIWWNAEYTQIERFQPIRASDVEIFEGTDGQLYMKFTWDYDEKVYTVPYIFVIHLKARFNRKRFMGTSPDTDLATAAEMLDVTYEGIKNSIKKSASLRGYLKYTNIADEEDLRQKVREFQEAYMTAENEGGLAGIDNSVEFKEITQEPRPIPMTQISFFRENIYRYFGVSEKILTSSYSEQDWNSFYESVIEPIAIQLSMEFTFKVFTDRERGFGNRIVFTANRLQYATLQTRASIGSDLFDRGVITINEYRELMYLPEIEDGDVRMISLNYVKADEQTAYQLGEGEKE